MNKISFFHKITNYFNKLFIYKSINVIINIVGDSMKKYIVFLLLLFFITGCNKKTENYQIDTQYNQEYYQIYKPYKVSASNNYLINNILDNYDLENIEDSLMALSSNYFNVNNSLYQEGQYLTYDNLKELLSKESLNKADEIDVNGDKIIPTYLTTIYEQNYLASNGNLKGISLGIILNPYQSYKNSYGSYNYKTIDNDELIKFGEAISKQILNYFRNEKELNDTKILLALYIQPKPNSMEKGTFKEVAITTNSNLKFESLKYQYEFIKSNYVINNDITLYNTFNIFEEKLKNIFSKLYINGEALYQDKTVKDVRITIGSSKLNRSEILYLSQIISEDFITSFSTNINIRIYIESNEQIKALITKDKNTSKSNVSIIGE